MPVGAAWERFGNGNGYAQRDEFYERIPETLELDAITDDTMISCLILDGLRMAGSGHFTTSALLSTGGSRRKVLRSELPAYDIEYESDGLVHAIDVKGTAGSYFPAIELTINEWRSAEQLRDRFWLYLVTNCEGREPCVQIIRDPFSLVANNQAVLSPLVVRFELRSAPVGPSEAVRSP
jgi:hypothetical protein